ncbi:histidine kinase, partial [bacterium]|nr:histidine kinase [bacterium]
MRFRQKINNKLVIGILFLQALILVIAIGSADETDNVAAIFFTVLVITTPIATLGYFAVNRVIQKRKVGKGKEDSSSAEEGSPKTQINPHLSRRKITKKLVTGLLLFLKFFPLTAPVYFVVNRFIQKRKAKKLEQTSLGAEADSPKTQISSSLAKRKITKKLVIGVLLLLLVLLIIIIASTSNDGEAVLGVSFGFATIGTLLFLVVDRFIQKRKVRQLKEASLRAEVDSLKTQINPHFFFNTLNNLYGLTVEKSDMAPEVILKLSDMMRYTIYEGEKDRVALKDEITYLESFIELQKIRFHRELDIKFEHFIEEVDIKVPPLLFIVLVENAFKHGAESLTENAFIHIKLMSLNGSVLFETQNNFEADEGTGKSGGIGLKNLQRRLQLLFPDEHTLLIDGTSN